MGMDLFFFSETTLQESKTRLGFLRKKLFSEKKMKIWSCMGKQFKTSFSVVGYGSHFFFVVWTASKYRERLKKFGPFLKIRFRREELQNT